MRNQLLPAIVVALLTFVAGASADTAWRFSPPSRTWVAPVPQNSGAHLRAAPVRASRKPGSTVFQREEGLTGRHLYIIRFDDAPLAGYRGGVAGLAATGPDSRRAKARKDSTELEHDRLAIRSAASIAYLAYLDGKHDEFLLALQKTIAEPQAKHRYRYALNGMTVRMTQQEAARVARLEGVAAVQRDAARQINSSDSVALIGAPQVWDGSATGGIAAKGEGVIVGIIDTGINTDHPSFAEVSPGDGYVHQNPLGNGNFLHDCAPFDAVTNPLGGQPELCNNKLIGTKVMPLLALDSGQNNAEDLLGHGSHISGAAAGNLSLDVPLVDSEGGPTSIVFDQVSGVAPRANIIAYKACSDFGCATADLLAAIDTAISDGVDVINFSIGSGPFDPWIDPLSLALLGARAGGIFVSASAGRSGPGPGTIGSPATSPWLTSATASTDQRGFTGKIITDLTGGDTAPPGDIPGTSATDGYGPASLVYAGDFGDPLCSPGSFLPGTFNGEIVLCDRGSVALLDKAVSVRNGGAGAIIIADRTPSSQEPPFDLVFVIPGIQIGMEDGDDLRTWLSSGSGHMATIAASAFLVDDGLADIIDEFSSRGPNSVVPDIISPSVAAPGIDIYAPYIAPLEYQTLSGTSITSAHVAGAGALLRQVHSDWSAAEIHSALVSTGIGDLVEADQSPGTPFAFGGGRIQVDAAVNAGLVMHETTANFEAADPALGGDPKMLNLPSFADSQCLGGTCSWQRTVRATASSTWTASSAGAAGLGLAISPSAFTLAEGETTVITVTADMLSLPYDEWFFGWVNLTPDNPAIALQSLPVAVNRETAFLAPDEISLAIRRDAGTLPVDGFNNGDLADLSINAYGPAEPDVRILSIEGEAGDFTPFVETGVGVEFYSVPAGTFIFSAATANSTAPDVDLFIGHDQNNDGQISNDELLCESGNVDDNEYCELTGDIVAQGGSFWVAVINFTSSAPGATDDTELTVLTIGPGDGSLYAEPPAEIVAGQPWQIRVGWDIAGLAVGEQRFGAVELLSSASQAIVPVVLERLEDDVRVSASATEIEVDDIVDMQIEIEANLTPEDLDYTVNALVPDGFELVPGSFSASAGVVTVIGGNLFWSVSNPSLLNAPVVYAQYINGPGVSSSDPLYSALCDTGFGGYIDLEGFDFAPEPGISGDSVSFVILEGQELPFYGVPKTGLTITDDGFAVFDSQLGTQPWVNTDIPDKAEPNDMIAMAWGDLEIVYDPGSNSGVTVALAGPNLSVVEFDDMQPWPAGSSPDRIDFEVIINGSVNDDPGKFELVVAYDNITGDWSGVTAGVENGDGTAGTQYTGLLSDGLMICYDLVGPDVTPRSLDYQIQAVAGASGEIVHEVLSVVTNPGSMEEVAVVVFDVAADTDGDGLLDSVDNCIAVANAGQTDTDGDGHGNICDADIDNNCFVNFTDLSAMQAGFFTVNPALDLDSSGGPVNFADLAIMKNLFFLPPGPSAPGSLCNP